MAMLQALRSKSHGVSMETADQTAPVYTVLVTSGNFPIGWPGIVAARGNQDGQECLVKYALIGESGLRVPGVAKPIQVPDCSAFVIEFVGRQWETDPTIPFLNALLFESLHAINDAVLWSKTIDQAKKDLSYSRQVGFLDIRLFFAIRTKEALYAHKNPLLQGSGAMFRMLSGLMPNARTSPNPFSNPLPKSIRRAMGILDLFNQGFFSEAFIAAFSMVDDIAQRVVEAGLTAKKIGRPRDAMRMIKEDRLRSFLNVLTKLCDWVALEEVNPELWKRLKQVNELRNAVVHRDKEIGRDECYGALDTSFATIGWLAQNPFGVKVAWRNDFRLVRPTFMKLAWEEPPVGASNEGGTSPSGSVSQEAYDDETETPESGQ
jgi:hypothetical protein